MPLRRLIASLAFALAGAASAQPAHTGGVGGMATRSVSHYLAVERQLQESLAQRDTSAASAMLADDFEARTPASPDTVDRDTWLRTASNSGAGLVRDLVTREAGDVTVVSFLLDTGTGRRRHTAFVVDVWRGDKLLTRMSAPTSNAVPPPSRPTGRE